MSHHTTNSMWVTLLYHFFARLINHVSSHNQQGVSDIVPDFFARQSHESCLKLHDYIEQYVSDIALFLCQAVSSIISYQQAVSDTALFLCQAVSSVISHSMTNREWVHCFISLPTTWPSWAHDQQIVSLVKFSTKQFQASSCYQQWVSDMPSFPVTSLITTNRKWVTITFVFFQTYTITQWPTGSVWYDSTYWSLYILLHNQQEVSGIAPYIQNSPWKFIMINRKSGMPFSTLLCLH